MKKARLLALVLALVMITSLLPISVFAASYEWWDLRGYTEQEYDSAVMGTDSPFAGYRDLVGTYGEGGPQLSVRHYWGWYVENPNSTRQRIDIYVPSNATENSPILHMVNNGGWTANSYPYSAPAYDAKNGVFTPGNNTSANALHRGYIVMTSGVRTYGMPSAGDEFGKSPATFADSKAAMRFLRANMGPDKAIKVGNPELAFVTGWSGGGALSNVLGASGNSADYFASMYEVGTLGLKWISATPFASATLEQKTDAANWSNTLSDAYLGVVSWCAMDDFQMGEQALAWFTSEKRWAQPNPGAKLPSMMVVSNSMAAEYVDYVNELGLKDEKGDVLNATFTVKENPEEGGVAGGSFLDATIDLVEAEVARALTAWKTGKQTDHDADIFPVVDSLAPFWNMESSNMPMGAYDYALVNASVLINGKAPTEALADPAQIPENPTVEITDHTKFTLGLTNAIDKGSVFAFGSHTFGFVPFDPLRWDNVTDTAGLYGADDQSAMPMHKTAWDCFCGSAEQFPRTGKLNTGMEWEDYLKTEAGRTQALQLKMASSMPYLNAGKLEAFPYLSDAGIYGSSKTDTAKYWFARFGMNDQSNSYSMRAMYYYSLMNNPAVDFEKCDLHLYCWNKPHMTDYENIFPWIDEVVAAHTGVGMANFKIEGSYKGYPDVDETAWYGTENSGVIRGATLLGIVEGDDTGFRPADNIKLSECIKMAAVVHDLYHGTGTGFDMTEGEHWYDTYVSFALKQGIIQAEDFADYEENATRAQMAYIFAKVLPAKEFLAISKLTPPDVTEKDPYADEIRLLYASGVLQGNDDEGTFTPAREITCAEAAAIITQIALRDERAG